MLYIKYHLYKICKCQSFIFKVAFLSRVRCLATVKDNNLEIEKLMQNRGKSFRQGKMDFTDVKILFLRK